MRFEVGSEYRAPGRARDLRGTATGRYGTPAQHPVIFLITGQAGSA